MSCSISTSATPATNPRLRRLSSPTDLHETYWEFASQSPIVDVAVDLLGPDVKFHHSKLNFKAPHGGEEVKWHQDIQFWPHTNYDLLTIGVFLTDVEPGMGEVGFVPGSHDGALYDLYEGDRWVGALSDDDVTLADVERAEFPVGPAGTITVHSCRTVHGSAVNRSDRARPLLLQTYAAADAFVLHGPGTSIAARRGAHPGNAAALGAPRPTSLPAPAHRALRPIFAAQQRED